MSRNKFDDNCPGCRPALMDLNTGKVCTADSVEMKTVMAVWQGTTLAEREAFHRFTCLKSCQTSDVILAEAIWRRITMALKAVKDV